MKLTIGIPNYNGGELLKKTIISCENMNLGKSEYEILIVDNCSNDDTLKIISDLQKNSKNIRLEVNSENIGRIGNWNKVVECAKGEYILILMVGDVLFDFDFTYYYSHLHPGECLVFGIEVGGNNMCHWAQEKDMFLPVKDVLHKSIATLGHNYGLSPLQTHFFYKKIIEQNKIRFDEEYEFLSDLKFINSYIHQFECVKLIDKSIVKWGDGKHKVTFQKQLIMYKEYLHYFPDVFPKYVGKKINLFTFKIYIIQQVFFIYLNNYRLGFKGYTLVQIYTFMKDEKISRGYFLSLILFPFYILYLYLNMKINFRYPIYFNKKKGV